NNAAELEQAIRKTSAGGSTSLYNAVYIALKDLKKVVAKSSDEIRRQAIVVLSEGEDTSSLLPFEEVLDLAKRSETAIYAIGLRVPDGPGTTTKGFREAEFVMRQFSQETGGCAVFPGELPALSHTFVIGMQTMAIGHVPVAGATSAISTFVWLLALAYLYIEMTTDERAMGVFILPLLIALQAIPAFRPGVEDRAPVLQGPLFGVHVSSLLFAYASFALACVIGITYVLLFKEIKAKHLGFFYARLPSLQVLDRMN